MPVLVWDGNAVKSLSGQGRAPLSPEAIAWYMEHGIPDHDIKMAPVPSVVDLCITLLQHYGTQSFAAIVAPTLPCSTEVRRRGIQIWRGRCGGWWRKSTALQAIAKRSCKRPAITSMAAAPNTAI